jgi:hypothetical protein
MDPISWEQEMNARAGRQPSAREAAALEAHARIARERLGALRS